MSMILITLIILIVVGIGSYYYFYQNKHQSFDGNSSNKNASHGPELKDTKRKLDDQFNIEQKKKQAEIDRILDKINVKGLGSISKAEKQFLDKNASK